MGVMRPVKPAPSPLLGCGCRGGDGPDGHESRARRAVAVKLNNAGADLFEEGNLGGARHLFEQALGAFQQLLPDEKPLDSSVERQASPLTQSTIKRGARRSSSSAAVKRTAPSSRINVCELNQGPIPKRQKTHEEKSEKDEPESTQHREDTDGGGAVAGQDVPPPITPLSNLGLYREEAEDDLGTVCFDDPVRFAANHDFPGPSPSESAASTCCYNIALVHQKNGSTDAALLHFERALSLLQQQRPSAPSACSGSSMRVLILNNIGRIHFLAGRSEIAMDCFVRALSDGEEEEELKTGEDEKTILTRRIASVFDRGFPSCVDDQGEEEEAVPSSEAWLLPRATTLANIGQLYFRSSNFAESMTACRAASAIRRRVLGEIGPNGGLAVAAVEYNMGLISHKLGNVAEARAHYESFLSVARRPTAGGGLGDSKEARAILCTARHQVGLLQGALGRTDESIKTLTDVLRVRREVYGPGPNSEVAKTLFSIGQVRFENGSHDLAMDLFRRTLCMAREVLKPDHMIFVFTYSYVGQILHAKGNTGQAVAAYERALAFAKRVFGERHYIVIKILNQVGNLRLARCEYGAAWNCFAKASGIVVQTMLMNNDSNGRGVVVTKCQKKVAASA